MEENNRVLIVDDEKMIREAVSAYFSGKGCIVYEADNGKDAIGIFKSDRIDFVILDLMLPEIPGEEVCRQIRSISQVPIIMLTAKTGEESVLNGLSIGADDYVKKPFSVKELYARYEVIKKRAGNEKKAEHPSDKTLIFKGGLLINLEDNTVRKSGSLIALTKSEWKILASMTRYPQKTFTREELMEIAFGENSESFDRVIDTHIKNLRKKLEDEPKNPVYIKTVHGFGYRFGGEAV
ncbi:MAG: response regulator transcription factor [Lachnospiraceae bacterium]|nr:response regulator transcription factor [Lachnospiraceae bacterium]